MRGTQLWFFEIETNVRYRLGKGFVVVRSEGVSFTRWTIRRDDVDVAEATSLDDALSAVASLDPPALEVMAAEVWCHTCESWRPYRDRGHLFCSERCKELHEANKRKEAQK